MKRILITFQIVFFLSICTFAQKVTFDYKYVTVGVYGNCNSWPKTMQNSNNFRYLGTSLPQYDIRKNKDVEAELNSNRVGKKILDILLERDYSGLHMDRLYEQALRNTTIEEWEVAVKDVSAETKDILKREVAHQLLKNNYIVVFQTNTRNRWLFRNRDLKQRNRWAVYHVDIDDRIIEQTYSNWRNPSKYDQIEVPVKYVAKGRVRKSFDNDNLVFKIAKEVPTFAVRGPLTNVLPHTARITRQHGVKNSNRICIYKIKENRKGDIYSKKVCWTRASAVDDNSCKMFKIAGNMPSLKKGEIAVLRDRKRSSFSLLGDYSGGGDARVGGRLQYDYMFHCWNGGITNYLIASVGYCQYQKEPLGIWWGETQSIQPKLVQQDIIGGYGMGFNLLGRIEMMPYVMFGQSFINVTNVKDKTFTYWDSVEEKWITENTTYRDYNENNEWKEYDSPLLSSSFMSMYVGSKININLHYPLQLTLGADYNMAISNIGANPFLDRHIIKRINVYAGLRFHF